LDRGYQFAPFGRTVTPAQFMACPGALESIPAPSWVSFMSSEPYDLYDVATWRRLRMSVFRDDADDPTWIPVVAKRLANARATCELLDRASAPRRLVCICGTGLPTQMKIVVREGRAWMPGEGRTASMPEEALADGDGTLTVEASSAWTGAKPEVVRIKVKR